MEFSAQESVAQERLPVFGRKHDVEKDLGEGLGHAHRLSGWRDGFNPFRVVPFDTPTQGSPAFAVQPWAGGLNAVGVPNPRYGESLHATCAIRTVIPFRPVVPPPTTH